MSPSVWRLHTTQTGVKIEDRCRFCVDSGMAGVGWSVGPSEDLEWGEYCTKARLVHDRFDSVVRLHDQVQIDDLFWTRDSKGQYWLGRVVGEWEYRHSPLHEDADIHNVRPCEWQCVGDLAQVPGKVRNSFIKGQALQRVNDETVKRFSLDLYNRRTGCAHYELPDLRMDLFSLFGPDDCEDLVAVYLQQEGWLLYPGTCKIETPQYEFVLRHSRTMQLAAVQVKQGDQELVVNNYEDFEGEVFLFQTKGRYVGQACKTTTTMLNPDEMKRFCVENAQLMSPIIQKWIGWCN